MNKEERKEYYKEYYKKNKEKYSAEEKKEYHRQYYLKNKEKYSAEYKVKAEEKKEHAILRKEIDEEKRYNNLTDGEKKHEAILRFINKNAMDVDIEVEHKSLNITKSLRVFFDESDINNNVLVNMLIDNFEGLDNPCLIPRNYEKLTLKNKSQISTNGLTRRRLFILKRKHKIKFITQLVVLLIENYTK